MRRPRISAPQYPLSLSTRSAIYFFRVAPYQPLYCIAVGTHNMRHRAILTEFSLALFSLSHISANSANILWAAEPEVGIHQREVVAFNSVEAILIGNQAIDIMGDNVDPEVKVGSYDD